MKLRCRVNILPSVDVSAQVFWGILSKNIVNKTMFYLLFILNFFTWIILALKYSLLETQIDKITMLWNQQKLDQDGNSIHDDVASSYIINSFIYSGIGILAFQITTVACILYLFRHYSKLPKHHTTLTQVILKYLNIILILENTPVSPIIKIVALAPLTQLTYYQTYQAQLQLALSILIICLRTLSFYIYQKVLVLRYQNDLIPWSKPTNYAVIFDYIQHCLLVVFVFQLNLTTLLSVIFKFIIGGLSVAKVVMMDKLVERILNHDIETAVDCEYALYYMLNLVLKKKNNHQGNNEYDGIIQTMEMNEHLYHQKRYGVNVSQKQQIKIQTEKQGGMISQQISGSIFQNAKTNLLSKFKNLASHNNFMEYSSKLEEYYQDYIDIQEEYMNRSAKQDGGDSNRDISINGGDESNRSMQGGASMYFQSQSIPKEYNKVLNFTSDEQIDELIPLQLEYSTHQLDQCFRYDYIKKQKINELDELKANFKSILDRMREKEEQLKLDKIQFIVDNLLTPYMKKHPDCIPLMFCKCYLNLILLQNRFICLTVITAIENLNQEQNYIDQIENKISQQFLLEICIKHQSKQNDRMDSTQLLEYNLKINQFFDLLLKSSKHILDFWQLLHQEYNYKQVRKLEKLSVKISDFLRQIKHKLSQLEEETPLLQVSEQILFFTAVFYQMALRDMYLSDYYFKKITQNRGIVNFHQMNNSIAAFDEISLVIVDGNLQNMGKIMYLNKILLKHLKYRAEHVIGQTVHLFMPREIAIVHDKFWNRFRETGKATILEQERVVFIKDQEGNIFPFEIFIKFMYHQYYGYTFLGIFKKLKKMIFAEPEQTEKLNQIFFFIANHHGKITEISANCKKYIGLSQEIFESLSSFLEEGLKPYHFNPSLTLEELDFSKGSCVLINRAVIDTSIVTKYSKELEIQQDENIYNRVKAKVNVSIKIIKEVYGNNSEVTLYYFMFQIYREQTVLTVKEGVFEKLILKANQIGENDSYEYNRFTDSIQPDSLMSFAANQSSQSMSSQSIASNETQGEDLKFLEDNIDYNKTPKQLFIVKIIFNTIIILIISLTVSLLVLNQMLITQQFQQLNLLKISNENMLMLSELSILSRSFVNINLGIEPGQNSFTADRKKTIIMTSLEIIENIRLNQKDISQNDDLNDNRVQMIQMTSKYLNGSIYNQSQLFNLAINNFIVQAMDLFEYGTFISRELSYLNNPSTKRIEDDLTVYYVIMNTNLDLRVKTQLYSSLESQFVTNNNENILYVTKVFVIVASCTILLGAFSALYFYSKIINNQSKTLGFFSELKQDVIEFCIKGSQAFYVLMQEDNEEIILLDSQAIQKRKDLRIQEYEKQLQVIRDKKSKYNSSNKNKYKSKGQSSQSDESDQSANIQSRGKQTNPTGQTFQTTGNVLETSDMGLLGKKSQQRKSKIMKAFFGNQSIKSRNKSQLNSPQSKISEENTKKQVDEEEQESSVNYQKVRSLKGKEKRSTHSLAEILQNQQHAQRHKIKKLDRKFQKYKNKESSKTVEVVKIRVLGEQDEDYQSRDSEQISPDNIKINMPEDLKQIQMQWKVKKMGIYGLVFIIISTIFVAYFLIQYTIVDQVHTKMQEHTDNMSLMYLGQTCMNWHISDMREMEIRNDTSFYYNSDSTYDLCQSYIAGFNSWITLNNDNSDIQALNQQVNSAQKICNYLSVQDSINLTNCNSIYNGVMQNSYYQVQSVFLHDTLQQDISFFSSSQRSSLKYLNQTVSQPSMIELIDANLEYLSKLNYLIADTVHSSLTSDENQLYNYQVYVFAIYMVALVAALMILNCFVFVKMRKSIWNSKIIFKLLPLDELDLEFKKKVSIFLFKQ